MPESFSTDYERATEFAVSEHSIFEEHIFNCRSAVLNARTKYNNTTKESSDMVKQNTGEL